MFLLFFFLMIRRPPRSTLDRSSAASDVYKRQEHCCVATESRFHCRPEVTRALDKGDPVTGPGPQWLSLIHISEPTRPY